MRMVYSVAAVLAWAGVAMAGAPAVVPATGPATRRVVTPFTPVPAQVPAAVPATRPAAATAAAASAPAVPGDAFSQDLLKRLNSTDAAQKGAAQKQLAAIAGYWQQPEMLKRMAEATADAELKTLLQDRYDKLMAKQAVLDITNLPPISLSVSNATLPQLAAALNEALNTTKFQTTGASAAMGYTLDVRKKPFWEVFVALCQQQTINMTSMAGAAGTGNIRLMPGGTGQRRYAIDGPAIAYVSSINLQRSISLQTPNGEGPVQASLNVQMTMCVDPRITVVRYQGFTVVSATDDAGHNLARPGGGTTSYMSVSTPFTQSIMLLPPDNLGKSIALTCETRIVAQAGEITGAIEDVQGNLNKPVTLGNRSFRVAAFSAPAGGAISMQISSTTVAAQPGVPATRVTYNLYDSAGKAVWTGAVAGAGSMSMNVAAGASTGPYKLEIRAPDKTVDIPVHFELKDIPFP